jgi:hypothetical protein
VAKQVVQEGLHPDSVLGKRLPDVGLPQLVGFFEAVLDGKLGVALGDPGARASAVACVDTQPLANQLLDDGPEGGRVWDIGEGEGAGVEAAAVGTAVVSARERETQIDGGVLPKGVGG